MNGYSVINASDPIEGSWEGLTIRVAQESDFPAMLEHVRENFCRDEPLCQYVGYTPNVVESMLDWARRGLTPNQRHSLVALDEATGLVAGVRVSCLLTPELEKAMLEDRERRYDEAQPLVDIFYELSDSVQPNIFEKYDVEEVVEFRLVSVDRNFRQRNLALEMILRSLRLAKKEGVPLVKAYFTSAFSRKVGEKLGFEPVTEFLYPDYKKNGKVVFDIKGPHKGGILMVKHL